MADRPQQHTRAVGEALAAFHALGGVLPTVAAGQQVIDRRNSDTYTAISWNVDLELVAIRCTDGAGARIPWRDVVPAGRARKARR